MGTTNLQHALNRKLSRLKGERDATRSLITRTEEQMASLPEMRAKVTDLELLIEHASALMLHLQPSWRAGDNRSIQPFVKLIPTKLGTCSRKAMDILRSASEPTSARELAMEILRREGISDATPEVRQRMANTVQAALRSRRGKVVECDGHWPQRWWVIQPSFEHAESN